MAISIYSAPKLVSLVGDPVLVTVLTNTHLLQGNKALYDLSIYGISNVGKYFEVVIPETNQTIKFDLVETLTKSTDIIAYDYFAEYADFMQHAADRISAIYEIRSKFTVQKVAYGMHPNGVVRFESIVAEDITLEISIGSTASTDLVEEIPGNIPVWEDGYMVGIRIFDENFGFIGELAERPPLDGLVTFNIKALLEKLPDPGFDLQVGILEYNNTCKAYKFQIYDKSGIPAVEQTTVWSEIYFAIAGKSSYMKRAIRNEELGSFYNELVVNKSFLTLQPNNKLISPFALELLSFLVLEDTIATVKLHLKIMFTDGNSHEVDVSTINAIYGRVLQINISPQLLSLYDYDNTKTVANFTVSLLNELNVPISQERTYIIDYDTYDYLRFFIFRNDYGGGYDVMRSTGEAVNTASVKKEFANRALPYDYTTADRKEIQVSEERVLEWELNWGLLHLNGGTARDWKNYIQQIELSPDVFEYINGIIVACTFITDNYNLHTDNRNIYTHKSIYRRAFVDEAYSDDDIPVIGDYSDDFNEDYFI